MGLAPQTPRRRSRGLTAPRRSGGARRARPRDAHVKNALVRGTEAQQVRQQLIGAHGTGWKLAPQSQTNIDPATLAAPRFDQSPPLDPRVPLEGILELDQINVRWVPVAEEIQSALLHPVPPRRWPDQIRPSENGVVRFQDSNRRVLGRHSVTAHLSGERSVLCLVEFELVVLNDEGPTGVHILEQPIVVGAQVLSTFVRAHP